MNEADRIAAARARELRAASDGSRNAAAAESDRELTELGTRLEAAIPRALAAKEADGRRGVEQLEQEVKRFFGGWKKRQFGGWRLFAFTLRINSETTTPAAAYLGSRGEIVWTRTYGASTGLHSVVSDSAAAYVSKVRAHPKDRRSGNPIYTVGGLRQVTEAIERIGC